MVVFDSPASDRQSNWGLNAARSKGNPHADPTLIGCVPAAALGFVIDLRGLRRA